MVLNLSEEQLKSIINNILSLAKHNVVTHDSLLLSKCKCIKFHLFGTSLKKIGKQVNKTYH
jgi:hypothetical protein